MQFLSTELTSQTYFSQLVVILGRKLRRQWKRNSSFIFPKTEGQPQMVIICLYRSVSCDICYFESLFISGI